MNVNGIAATSYLALIARLAERFPGRSMSEIEAVVQRENDAFTGGRPLVVPVGVETGAIELLGDSAA
jgi:hypothetical protein